MAAPKQQYIFDIEKIKLPPHLHTVLTRECSFMLQKVVDNASLAFRHLKNLELIHDERYKAMCSRHNVTQYILHAESVDLLFGWDQDRKPYDPVLAPPAKIPPQLLHFHLDRYAYDQFTHNYHDAVESYLHNAYYHWRNSKKQFERMVVYSGITEVGYQAFLLWWRDTFLAEMAKWENRLAGLVLPSWESLIDDLYLAISERVDIGTSGIDRFYIGSVP